MLAASCSNESETIVENQNEKGFVPVTVQVSDFSMSQEDFSGGTTSNSENAARTRTATSVADYSGVKAITLAFYNSDGTTQAYSTTQLKADNTTYTTFGNFSLSLPVGSYKMIVLGYGSDYPVVFNSMTDVTSGEEKNREMFCNTQDVIISNAAANDLSATLSRVNSRLHVISTDLRPADATVVRITFAAGGKNFNPLTGLATSNTGYVCRIMASTSLTEVVKSRADIFLTDDEQTMDVTIETLDDNDNVLFSKTVSDVPFKRNRITTLTGAMYSPGSASASFTVETDWLEEHTINF